MTEYIDISELQAHAHLPEDPLSRPEEQMEMDFDLRKLLDC